MDVCYVDVALIAFSSGQGLAEVAAAGRWAGGGSRHLVNSYLTNPAMETTRQAAGQPPLGGAFNIARLSLLPTRAQLRGLVPDLCAANTKQENLSATERNQNLYLSGRAMETCIQHFVAHVSLNFEDTHPCTGILNVPFFKPGTAAHPSVFAQYRKAHTAAMAEHQRNEITQARESLQLVDTLTARAVSKFASAISCSSALLSSSSSSSSSSLSPSSSSSSSSYPATSSLSTSSRRPNVSPNTNRLLQQLRGSVEHHAQLLSEASTARGAACARRLSPPTAPTALPMALSPGVPIWLGPVPPLLVKGKSSPPAEATTRGGSDFGATARSWRSVRDVADEYLTPGGTRDVEMRWGEGKPGVCRGYSWRGAKTRGTALPSISSLWSLLKPLYDAFDSAADDKGRDDKIKELQGIIDTQFPGKTPKFAHIEYLSSELKSRVDGFAERSAQAAANRASQKRKRDAEKAEAEAAVH